MSFPKFILGGSLIQYVQIFKYLGHIIIDTLSDDDDMQRGIRKRTNILARCFASE